MRFTAALLISALLSTAASASAQTTTLPACEPPNKSGIFLPKKGATLSSSAPFQLYYCSAQYFRSHTTAIDVLLSTNASALSSGALLASGLTATPVEGSSYLYNITIPSYATPRGKVYIGIFERFSGYYNAGYNYSTVAVTVK
ncbi:hypothetical protein OC834_002963 [Tilletia horrida]|uniref:Spore coat protein U domain-containing protein n=1 Tax=Tilletia horrida TaxID=155126 RepID=A0AAN6GCU2_9BASI|nr:hypothetical protein OC834_002963 [Tilletia horrida]KAK0533802.1 hypothetical protein OC842_002862 [Tilletia horrida]KAK0534740.1 hypothetical protein OC835_002586 [Tilletia horrida]